MDDRSNEFGAEDVFLEHASFVRQLARRLSADEHQADDITQDAWMIALRSRDAVRGSMRAWLAGVVAHLAADQRRAHGRRRRRESEVARPESVESFESEWLAQSVRESLEREVRKLAPGQREVIVLRYYEGLSPPEIADRLALPLENVRTKLKRGLAELRERLGDRDRHEVPSRGSVLTFLFDFWRRRSRTSRWSLGAAFVLVVAWIGSLRGESIGAALDSSVARADQPTMMREESSPLDVARANRSEADAAANVDEQPPGVERVLAGRVLAQNGTPVVGADIVWYRRGEAGALVEAGRTASDAVGAFELSGVEPNFVLDASTSLLRSRLQAIGVRAARGRIDGLEFTLEPNVALRGRVVDESGAPIEAVTLTLGSRAVDTSSRPSGFTGVRWGRDANRIEFTGRTGRFEFAGLPPGRFRLTAAHPRFERVSREIFAGSTEVELVLAPGVAQRWRVVDREQRAVEGALARIWANAVERTFVTDANGELPLPRWSAGQELDVAIEAVGFAHLFEESVLVDGAQHREFVLERPREVRGVLFGRDGRPLQGANLIARAPPRQAEQLERRVAELHNVLEKVRTDSEGRFVFAKLPQAALTVDVWLQRGSEAVETFELDSEESSVEWRVGATDVTRPPILLRVRDAASGARIESCVISATPRGATLRYGTRVHRARATEGDIPWRALDVGRWWLHVEAQGYAAQTSEIEVSVAENIFEFELHRATECALSVVDAAGAPLAFATVRLQTADGGAVLASIGGDKLSDEVVLDGDGRARIAGLPAARLDLDVWSAWSDTPERVRVDLASPASREVVVTLARLHRADMTRSMSIFGLAAFEGHSVDVRVRDGVGAERFSMRGRVVEGTFEPAVRSHALIVLRRTIDLAAAHPSDTWREPRRGAWFTPDGCELFGAGIEALPLPAGRAEVSISIDGFEPEQRVFEPGPLRAEFELDPNVMRRSRENK